MEDTYYALGHIWTACADWFDQAAEATGIPIFEILLAFASLGIIFKLLVFPFLGYESQQSSLKERKHK